MITLTKVCFAKITEDCPWLESQQKV